MLLLIFKIECNHPRTSVPTFLTKKSNRPSKQSIPLSIKILPRALQVNKTSVVGRHSQARRPKRSRKLFKILMDSQYKSISTYVTRIIKRESGRRKEHHSNLLFHNRFRVYPSLIYRITTKMFLMTKRLVKSSHKRYTSFIVMDEIIKHMIYIQFRKRNINLEERSDL